MRLMIVEDNRTNLLVLKGIVQKFPDCEVEAFLDPVQAYARAEAELFDLILALDPMREARVGDPAADGVEAMRTEVVLHERQRPVGDRIVDPAHGLSAARFLRHRHALASCG